MTHENAIHIGVSLFVFLYVIITSLVVIFSKYNGLFFKFVSLLALVAAMFLMFQRNTYLPFLGKAAVPPTVLRAEFTPDQSNVVITVPVHGNPGDRVVYWGARPNTTTMPNPWKAYGNWDNAGVSVIDEDGQATLRFHCPAKYKVPWGRTLDRHIHYRTCCDKGMLSEVHTMKVSC